MANFSVFPMNGLAVNIAFVTTANGITITTPSVLATFILQEAEETSDAERVVVFDNNGKKCVSAWLDGHLKGSFKLLIAAATSVATALAATSLTALPPGVFVVITACASMPDLASAGGGSAWEIQSGVNIKGTNKDAKMVQINCEYNSGITVAAQV
jgi:hypothetical protein